MQLTEARKYALSLPEANEEPHHQYNSFRVKGKIFATVPPDNQHLHVFVDEQRRKLAISMFPDAYAELWWGKKAVGIKVLLSAAESSDVEDLIYSAWLRKAPTNLVEADRQ